MKWEITGEETKDQEHFFLSEPPTIIIKPTVMTLLMTSTKKQEL